MRTILPLASAALLLAACGGTAAHVAHPETTRVPGAPRIDPYRANLAFARCMRARGVAHPNPDRSGDFHLTPAQERAMRASATPKEHAAAEKACFHLLKGVVSTAPLSAGAMRAALAPLREVKRCLHAYGYDVGKPTVKNLSRGRAFFGFERAARPATDAGRARLESAQHACEKRAKLAQRIDAIVKADRGEGR